MTSSTTLAAMLSSHESAAPVVAPAAEFYASDINGYPVFKQTMDGAVYPWAMGSEFDAFRQFCQGVDLTSLFTDRLSVGQRGFSIFLMSSNIAGGFWPDHYGDQFLLEKLAAFCDLARQYGQAVEACVFQDLKDGTMPGASRQATFWSNVLDIAKSRLWVSVNWSKEWWKQRGATDFSVFRQPADQTWDGGTGTDQEGLAQSPLIGTHYTWQTPRTLDWPRKTKSAWDITTGSLQPIRACAVTEIMGAAEHYENGRRSNVPFDFYCSAAIARQMAVGCDSHGNNHVASVLFEPVQRECARAVFQAQQDIPAVVQSWGYAKALGSWAQAIQFYQEERAYGMVSPAQNEAYWVVDRPWGTRENGDYNPATDAGKYPMSGDMIEPAMLNGWSVLERKGPHGVVLHVGR